MININTRSSRKLTWKFQCLISNYILLSGYSFSTTFIVWSMRRALFISVGAVVILAVRGMLPKTSNVGHRRSGPAMQLTKSDAKWEHSWLLFYLSAFVLIFFWAIPNVAWYFSTVFIAPFVLIGISSNFIPWASSDSLTSSQICADIRSTTKSYEGPMKTRDHIFWLLVQICSVDWFRRNCEAHRCASPSTVCMRWLVLVYISRPVHDGSIFLLSTQSWA